MSTGIYGTQKLRVWAKVLCPYCGCENSVTTESYDEFTKLAVCVSDIGGCEREFVVAFEVEVSCRAFQIAGLYPDRGKK